MYVADTLSRAFLNEDDHDTDDKLEEELTAQIHMVLTNIPVSEQKLEEIKSETEKDNTLISLRTIIQNGWPNNKGEAPMAVQDYWNNRDELSETDGLLMKNDKLIIPASMRQEMLKRIHLGHLGIEKCKLRAREVMFWTGMSGDIEDTVSRCDICLQHRNSQQKETLVPHEIPERPWQILGTDLFSWHGSDYLLIVDYYSRYFETAQLPDTKSQTIIAHTKSILGRHGIPEEIKSDNGPQFTSAEYKKFTKEWEFKHITVSPRNPQANGLAEKTVQTVKRLLDKARMDGSDPYLSILEYRNTPIGECGSPAQMLMNRRLRSKLPCSKKLLIPTMHKTPAEIKLQLEGSRQKQKFFFDKHGKDLPALNRGDSVRVQSYMDGKWNRAVVKDLAQTPRSYLVETPDGQVLRRNRRHLMMTREAAQGETADSWNPESEWQEKSTTPSETTSTHKGTTQPGTEQIQSEGQTKVSETIRTSSGREIRRPARYQD
ncbi:UNVERIFIED_CONTAM: hypothetical protein FKN15_058554 [Acipenser sinensis]